VIVAPIGFVSDHMEVVYDLDRIAAGIAAERGVQLVRSATPGGHPGFVDMVCDLIEEASGRAAAATCGDLGPAPFPCPPGCCPIRAPA
jgi:ferrochelatase